MKKKFKLNKFQLAVLMIACKPTALRIPYNNRTISLHHQHAVNATWKYLGQTMGFLPLTVKRSACHGPKQFMAECCPVRI